MMFKHTIAFAAGAAVLLLSPAPADGAIQVFHTSPNCTKGKSTAYLDGCYVAGEASFSIIGPNWVSCTDKECKACSNKPDFVADYSCQSNSPTTSYKIWSTTPVAQQRASGAPPLGPAILPLLAAAASAAATFLF